MATRKKGIVNAVSNQAADPSTAELEALIDAADSDPSAVAAANIACGDSAEVIREKLRTVVEARLAAAAQ